MGLILLLGFGVVGLIVVVIVMSVLHGAKIDQAWAEAAKQLDMQFQVTSILRSRSIAGELYGCRVLVDVLTKGTGESSKHFTRYRIHHPQALRLGLSLKQEGVLSGLSRLVGIRDIEVGDPEFDEQFLVKGFDARHVVRFLTPARRLRILRLFESFKDLEIDDDMITVCSYRTASSADEIVSTVRRLALVAARLSAESQIDAPLDRSLEARREGRLDEALEHVQASTVPEAPADPDARMHEGAMLDAAGRREQAAEIFETASRESPEDEELQAWAREAATGTTTTVVATVPKPEPEPQRQPEPERTDVDTLGVLAICEDLFATKRSSLDAKRRFEEAYKNKSVRWKGKLRQAGNYSIDLVFGNEPGTKLVVDLHEFQGGHFGRMVQAIVQMPPDALQEFDARLGDEVCFEGRLVLCDPLMRNLYIADARAKKRGHSP